ALGRDRHADRDRQSVAEAAGGDLDARHFGIGVAAEDAVEAAELAELLLRKEALLLEQHIQGDAAVPLAQDEAVATGPFRVLRVVAQHAVEQHPQHLDERQRRADVAAPAALEHAHDLAAQMPGALVERAVAFGKLSLHAACSPFMRSRSARAA